MENIRLPEMLSCYGIELINPLSILYILYLSIKRTKVFYWWCFYIYFWVILLWSRGNCKHRFFSKMRTTFERVSGKHHIPPFIWQSYGSFTKQINIYQQNSGMICRLYAAHSREKLEQLLNSLLPGWSCSSSMKLGRLKFFKGCLKLLACGRQSVLELWFPHNWCVST